MAQSALRLRRAVPALRRSLSSAVPSLSPYPPLLSPYISSSSSTLTSSVIQSRLFRSSSMVSLSSSSSNKTYHLYKEGDEITPDTILFEGCDYNHWLIVMEFPKDTKPTAEEMVRTYEETCARGLDISLEEAKKRMYACSTTTYIGFQAVMTEEESEKFHGLPGVVFVLPDSYIDPQNKEYGGDKYINGTIIPRPPPIQYNTRGRSRDRSRNFDRRGPREPMQYQQGGPMQNQQTQQDNMQFNSQGPMRVNGGNYGAPQNYPLQQNYPSQQNYRPQQNYSLQQNYPPQQDYLTQQNYPPQQDYLKQQNYPQQPNYPSEQNFGNPGQGERGGHMPINNRDYGPRGRDSYQADRRGPMASYQGNYNQVGQGNFYPPQGNHRGYEQRTDDGTYGQGISSGYVQDHHGQGEGQRFSQVEQGNVQGQQRN